MSVNFQDNPDIQPIEQDAKQEIFFLRRFNEYKDSMVSNFIAIFGIFASFLIFLTVEIQILKTICDINRLIGFSIIISAIIVILVSVIYVFSIDTLSWKKVLFFIITCAVLFIIGFIMLFKSKSELVCNEVNVKKTFQETLNESTIDMKAEINSLQSQVDLLKNSRNK